MTWDWVVRVRPAGIGKLALAALVGSATVTVTAQSRDAMARLNEAKTIRCEFPTMATGDWKDGAAQSATKPATLTLRFEKIDVDSGIAEAVGTFGPSDINVRSTVNSLHFMQSFREGPLYLTTVIARPGKDGRWPAVHTRHEYTDVALPGYTSRPEQYYGTCSVEP